MEAYINSLACISHYATIDDAFFFEETPSLSSSNTLFISPPVYKDYIPANTIRRTSHILKMGISAGLMCLRKTGQEQTDAIVIGTAMGCFEDTDKFLRSLLDNDERMLTPTSFIQSTHNTVGGQIALLVKCHGYNFTYVHQNLSFEYAMLDALLLLKEKEAENVLIGGVDELIPPLCELFERAGHLKKQEDLSKPLWESTTKGYVAGEGAAFFSLSLEKKSTSLAKIKGVKTLQKIQNSDELTAQYNLFLKELDLKHEDVDLLLSGRNGDVENDQTLKTFEHTCSKPTAFFKNLCGEYFTASSFALWLACRIIQQKRVPDCAGVNFTSLKNLKNLVIVNTSLDQSYSFICVSAC